MSQNRLPGIANHQNTKRLGQFLTTDFPSRRICNPPITNEPNRLLGIANPQAQRGLDIF